MSSEKVQSTQKWVSAFSSAAEQSHLDAAVIFKNYVAILGGNFELAVNNVGNELFGKVMSHEHSMTSEQRKAKPGVFEAISKARAELNPQPIVSYN